MQFTAKIFLASVLVVGLSPALPAQTGNPVLSILNLVEGETTRVAVGNCSAGDVVQVAASLYGPGPISTVYGAIHLTPPLMSFPSLTANQGGVASMTASVPMGSGGLSVWLHAVDLTSGLLSNSLAERIDFPTPPIAEVLIPAGSFEMGDHFGGGESDELPLHAVTLDEFYMDQFEVTNQSYVAFLNDAVNAGTVVVQGGVAYGKQNQEPYCSMLSSDWRSRIDYAGGRFRITPGKDLHPVVLVSWYGAAAYANWRSEQAGLMPCFDLAVWGCNWSADGYRLPTEAEWEYAARGGAATYSPFYWGASLAPADANIWDSFDPFEQGDLPWTTPVGYYNGNQVPAGADRANGFGLYDMHGNLSEWCYDFYSSVYYDRSPVGNPTGPSSAFYKVFRSGGWSHGDWHCRSAERKLGNADYRGYNLGFRLVSRR